MKRNSVPVELLNKMSEIQVIVGVGSGWKNTLVIDDP